MNQRLSLSALLISILVGCADTRAPGKPVESSADTPDDVSTEVPEDDLDGDGFGRDTDCDDGDAGVFPGQLDLCDGIDNDCDGVVDPVATAYDDTGAHDLTVAYDLFNPDDPAVLRFDSDTTVAMCGDDVLYARIVVSAASLTLEGAGSEETMLDAAGSGSVVSVSNGGLLTVSRIGLAGGDATRGGGVRGVDSDVRLTNVWVVHNQADQGGGIAVDDGRLTMVDVDVRFNSADYAGGVWVDGPAVWVEGGEWSHNDAWESGGGGWLSADELSLETLRIADNQADLDAGGLQLFSVGVVSLVDVDVVNNGSWKHGGLSVAARGALSIVGGEVTGNVGDSGAGIGLWGGAETVIADTLIAGNQASSQGGAVYVDYADYGVLELNNARFEDNTPTDVWFQGEHLTVDGSGTTRLESAR